MAQDAQYKAEEIEKAVEAYGKGMANLTTKLPFVEMNDVFTTTLEAKTPIPTVGATIDLPTAIKFQQDYPGQLRYNTLPQGNVPAGVSPVKTKAPPLPPTPPPPVKPPAPPTAPPPAPPTAPPTAPPPAPPPAPAPAPPTVEPAPNGPKVPPNQIIIGRYILPTGNIQFTLETKEDDYVQITVYDKVEEIRKANLSGYLET